MQSNKLKEKKSISQRSTTDYWL